MSAGVKLNHIPYKGSGPSTADVVAGQIQVTFATAPGAVPFIKASRLRALAAASPRRSATLPDVPTFVELGLGDVVVTNWYSVVTPAGTPAAVIKRVHEETVRTVDLPDVRERLAAAALEPMSSTPAQFRQLIEREIKRWGNVIKDASIKTE